MASLSTHTRSTNTTETVHGELRFDITVPVAGPVLTSRPFAVGGFDWAIRCYPNVKDSAVTPRASARALFDLRLAADGATGAARSVRRSRAPVAFDASKPKKRERGARALMPWSEMAAPPYLRDGGRVAVECVLDVVREARVSETAAVAAEIVDPPPPDLGRQLGALLRAQVGADVAFAVRGETVRAHRAVLAARSPVFRAELSDSWSTPANEEEVLTREIRIDGMTPLAFKALLHFVCTDALPTDLGNLGREEWQQLVRNLLVGADRYAMGRLKQICMLIQQKVLDDVNTVAAALDSAGQHHRHHCIRSVHALRSIRKMTR